MSYPDYTVTIHTDGSCLGNPGPGGYAAIIRSPFKEMELFGGEPETTSNRMELKAVIAALAALKRPLKVKVVSDSQYVIKGMTEWIKRWKVNNWCNSAMEAVANRDLWQLLDALSSEHDVQWTWIRSHSGDSWNDKADALAHEGREKQSLERRCRKL